MKVNKWTLGLAAVGLVSLPALAQAEEKASAVMTALSSTTISGYVDTSAQWDIGTGNANLDEIRRAKEKLDAIGTPIIGAVLNRFEPKVHGPSNQPYRGYYRRSRP